MVQGNCQTLIQHGGAWLQQLGWPRFTMIFFGGVAAMVLLVSSALYDRFYTLIAFSEAIIAPMCGIALADRIVLRRNLVNVRALYAVGPDGAYAYWGGVNYAAFVAMLAGAVIYLRLLDPLAMVGTPLFTRISATLPSVVTAFVVHVVLTRVVVMRVGNGAYPADVAAP